MHELVVGRAQPLVAGGCAVTAAVDQRLRMLDAHADRERLGLDRHAALHQHLERVAGAVADRQHDMIGRDLRAVFQHHARDPAAAVRPLVDREVDDLAAKAILAAELLDRAAHVFHDGDQPEGADMRLGEIEDFGRRAGLDELGQHLAAVVMRVLDLAVQLAVGERAGAAFAELHIGFRVQLAPPPQAPGVLGALAHHLAALQEDRAKAHLRQDQSGEQAARAGADHDRA